jgi:alkylhydroperoxidase family enzyme
MAEPNRSEQTERRIVDVSFIRQIDEADAAGRLARIYGAALQRTGSVANIIKLMSLDPAACEASMQFYVALMKSPNALDPATREMLATVVSNVNDCYY